MCKQKAQWNVNINPFVSAITYIYNIFNRLAY